MADVGVLHVLLEGRVVGELESDDRRLQLRYDTSYAADSDATPLSLSLPPTDQTHRHAAITPWLWGLLPDNDAVLSRWSRTFGVSASSPFSLLGTPVGHDCAGAVQFATPDELDLLLNRAGSVDWLDEADVAERIRQLRADGTSWLGPGFTGQFSLGGAQAKTALVFEDGRWGVPSGSAPTTHIVKPAVAGFEAQDLNEHLCMTAAARLGLRVARSTVARFEDQTAVVVERYDRMRTPDGALRRIHQEDLCQATGTTPAAKYQAEGGPGPAQIADLFRRALPSSRAEEAVRTFADALVFNWLIAGTDAHAKNYSVMLAGPDARLAPLYDIASHLPYDTSEGHDAKLAMKLGGEYRLLLTDRRTVWERAAKDLGLRRDHLVARALELSDQVADAFAAAASDPVVADLESSLPARLVDLVARRARRCTAALS